jgi:hypothetical protein
VFLWASLIGKELLAAFTQDQTPSMAELLRLLDSVPTELSEYYHFIVQRIPKNLRWKTYALLEAVVRAQSQGDLRIDYLWRTVLISDSPDYLTAQATLRALDSRGYEYVTKEPPRSLLLWGGGLVSITSISAELMHQTVHEFVTRLNFKDQVLGPLSKVTHENGHTFHLKSVLTFRLNDIRPDISMLSSWSQLDDNGLRESMSHGAEAEETTGRSCRQFLDSLPSQTITSLTTRLIVYLQHWGYYLSAPYERDFKLQLIHSHAGLAAFFGLRLYLQDCLRFNPSFLASSKVDDLLRLLVIVIGFGDPSTHGQLISTTRFLLENGYDKSSIRSLFPYVLRPEFRFGRIHWEAIQHQSCLQAFEQLTNIFLEHDPACASLPIRVGRGSWVMPIHIAPPLSTSWLLDHGVDPNQQDSLGRTPLDHMQFRSLGTLTPQGLDTYMSLSQCASLLLRHGAKRGRTSRQQWKMFVERIEGEGLDASALQVMPENMYMERKAATAASDLPDAQITPATAIPEEQTAQPKSALSRLIPGLCGAWSRP